VYAPRAELAPRGFEVGKNQLRDAAAAHFRLDIHPLHLDSGRVEQPHGAASDRPSLQPRNDKCAQPRR
jgi:hypothetical protein